MSLRKQKRDNRYNINLTDSEADLFIAASKLSGVNIGVLLRQGALKHALTILIAEDEEDEFNLDQYLNKGASDHLSRS